MGNMQFGFVIENARCLIPDKGVLFPAIPQFFYNVDELIRSLVALVIAQMFVFAEVPGLLLRPGGNHVPSCAPAADMVDRRIFTSNVKWFVIGGRRRCNQTNLRSACTNSREQGQGFKFGVLRIMRQRALWIIRGANADAIGKKYHIELCGFSLASRFKIIFETYASVGRNIRVPPSRHMVPQVPHRKTQLHHCFLFHSAHSAEFGF